MRRRSGALVLLLRSSHASPRRAIGRFGISIVDACDGQGRTAFDVATLDARAAMEKVTHVRRETNWIPLDDEVHCVYITLRHIVFTMYMTHELYPARR